jgi:extracellular factor (EF) 3-hydroxypalmitic acid methyl ester biosynthesis protein
MRSPPKSLMPSTASIERFEEIIYALPPEARGAHQDFVRQHWHKLFLGSPFAHRTYHKPLGYAGDYEMMNMIHRNQPEGRSLYEKLIHLLLVSQWPARSVRNRIAHLGENIFRETARVARGKNGARILNVGCGPAREVQDFLRKTQLSNQAEFTLIDFNEETLAYAGQRLVEAKRQFSAGTRPSGRSSSPSMNCSSAPSSRRRTARKNST